jgi:hypothetical protein
MAAECSYIAAHRYLAHIHSGRGRTSSKIVFQLSVSRSLPRTGWSCKGWLWVEIFVSVVVVAVSITDVVCLRCSVSREIGGSAGVSLAVVLAGV